MKPPPALEASQIACLRSMLERGLPLVTAPYQQLAEQIGASEAAVLDQVQQWNNSGLFRRFGIVLQHRALGFHANAMLVLDVPDHLIDQTGQHLGSARGVNLCYQRPRRLPHWPYNLFCMIHGREHDAVCRAIEQLMRDANVLHLPHRILFSTRAFKQRGGRFTRNTSHG